MIVMIIYHSILSTNENAEMGHTRVFSLTFKNILAALGFTGGECGSAAQRAVGPGYNLPLD